MRDSHKLAVRLHSATPLLDPATRGISEPLLQRFRQENLCAASPDLRGRVLECLREVGADAVKQSAPRLQQQGEVAGIVLAPGVEAFEYRGPWKGVSAAVVEHSGQRYPPENGIFVGNTNGLTLKYVLRASPGGAVVCEDGTRVPVIQGTLLWLAKSAMYAFESDCTFLSISAPPFDPLAHRQAPAHIPAPETGRKVRVLEMGPFAFPLDKAKVGVARFEVEGRFPELGAMSNSKSRFLYFCCDAAPESFLILPELDERIPLQRGSLVHVNPREHFYWSGVMTLIAISSPKLTAAQLQRHQ